MPRQGFIALVLALAIACTETGTPLPEPPPIESRNLPASAQEALEQSLEAVRKEPRNAAANGQLAEILHAFGLHDAAIAYYKRALALSEGSFEWAYLLGVAQIEQGSLEGAADTLRHALTMRDHLPAAVRLGETLMALGRPIEARDELEQALQLDRSSPAAHYALGRVLYELGETSDAVAVLERAVELAPRSGAAHHALGMAYHEIGATEKAAENLELAERRERTKPALSDNVLARVEALKRDEHYYLNLGARLEQQGRLTESVAAYRQALEKAPDMVSAHVNLVGVLGRLGRFDEAESHYRAAQELEGNSPELHNNWGVVLTIRGEAAGATEAFEDAVKLDPQFADAHANLGLALLDLGRTAQAREHFETALRHSPSQRAALLHLGRLDLANGHLDSAIGNLQAALEGPPDAQTRLVLEALTEAYRLAGKEDEAAAVARKAESLTSLTR